MYIFSQSLNLSIGTKVLLSILKLRVPCKLETQAPTYPFGISAWLSHRHLQLKMAKAEPWIFPSSLALLSLFHLCPWHHHRPSYESQKSESHSWLFPCPLPHIQFLSKSVSSLSKLYLIPICFCRSWEPPLYRSHPHVLPRPLQWPADGFLHSHLCLYSCCSSYSQCDLLKTHVTCQLKCIVVRIKPVPPSMSCKCLHELVHSPLHLQLLFFPLEYPGRTSF